MLTPKLLALFASDVRILATPLTRGCQASVAIKTRIASFCDPNQRSDHRIAGSEIAQFISQPYDSGWGLKAGSF